MLENRTAAHQSDPLQFNRVGCLPILGGSHSLLPNMSPCQSVDITPRHSIAQHVSPSTAHGEGPMAGSNILVRWCLLFTSGVWFTSEPRLCQLGKQGKHLFADALERHLLPISLDNKKKSVRTFPSDAHLKGGQQKLFSSLLYNCQLRQVSIHARTSEKHRHLLVIKYQRTMQQCNTILVWLSGEVYLASLTGYPRDFGSQGTTSQVPKLLFRGALNLKSAN